MNKPEQLNVRHVGHHFIASKILRVQSSRQTAITIAPSSVGEPLSGRLGILIKKLLALGRFFSEPVELFF
jgi:hypothetical protein